MRRAYFESITRPRFWVKQRHVRVEIRSDSRLLYLLSQLARKSDMKSENPKFPKLFDKGHLPIDYYSQKEV